MTGWYDHRLVALSVLIAIFASHAALDLAGRVTAASGRARAAWLSGGAVAMGCGIWAMHYVGMLAFHLPIPVGYDWRVVLLSFLAAVAASAVALYVVSREKVGMADYLTGSVIMGGGIAAMHYIGVAAMRLAAVTRMDMRLVVLSVIIAIAASFAALRAAFRFRNDGRGDGQRKLWGAIALGAAIPAMHYTGMAALSFAPSATQPDLSHAVGVGSLGTTGVAIVASVVLALATATSWVDRRFAAHALELHRSNERYRQLFERSVAGVYLATTQGRILDCNDACCHIFGYTSRSDFLSRAERDLCLRSVDSEGFLQTLVQRKMLTNFERCLHLGGNHSVWVLENATLLDSDRGDPAIEGTLIDITDRKLAEIDLRRAHSLLEARQREIEEDLRLAERVQQTLVPRSITWCGASVETFYQAARTIGGDFGLVAVTGECLSIFVCDVSGHGIGSALIANRIYTETVGQIQRGTELAPMLRHLNEFVLRGFGSDHFYFTLAAARLKCDGHVLEFAGAGHPPAIVIRPGEQPCFLESQSGVLGLIENAVGTEATVQIPLQSGDRVVIYTDGFTESVNSRQEELGVNGLSEIVREASVWPLPQMKQHILDRVTAFRCGPPADDMSLVVLGKF